MKTNMRKTVIFVIFCLVSLSTFSQKKLNDISLYFSYPIPFGDNYISENYMGIFDAGIAYDFLRLNNLGMAISFNTSALSFPDNDVNLQIFSPKIGVNYELKLNYLSIIPQIQMGYSNWRFRASGGTKLDESGNTFEIPEYKKNFNGLTTRLDTRFVLSTKRTIKWFCNISYEYTIRENSREFLNNSYNRNIHIFYPGVGVMWSFAK